MVGNSGSTLISKKLKPLHCNIDSNCLGRRVSLVVWRHPWGNCLIRSDGCGSIYYLPILATALCCFDTLHPCWGNWFSHDHLGYCLGPTYARTCCKACDAIAHPRACTGESLNSRKPQAPTYQVILVWRRRQRHRRTDGE
jgi:hypothetical protein